MTACNNKQSFFNPKKSKHNLSLFSRETLRTYCEALVEQVDELRKQQRITQYELRKAKDEVYYWESQCGGLQLEIMRLQSTNKKLEAENDAEVNQHRRVSLN